MAQRGTTAEIDMGELEKLASMMATDEEIAGWFNVNVKTIERPRKDPAFVETIERGRAKGRISLRRSQFRLIEEGSAAMAIFLGKNYLQQSDQIRHDINGGGPLLCVVLPRFSDLQNGALIERRDADETLEIAPADYEKVSDAE
jgi:hypothetical protein